jgi:hypothetical protein
MIAKKARSGNLSIIIGGTCIFLALASALKVERPPNSTGSLLDDMPFIGGQLFVSLAVFVVGAFLLGKGIMARRPPTEIDRGDDR